MTERLPAVRTRYLANCKHCDREIDADRGIKADVLIHGPKRSQWIAGTFCSISCMEAEVEAVALALGRYPPDVLKKYE